MQTLRVARRLPVTSSFSQITGSGCAAAVGVVACDGCCGCDCAAAGEVAKTIDPAAIEAIQNFIGPSLH